MSTAFKVKFKAKKGKQAPEQFEAGVKDTLNWAVTGKSEEQVGFSATETVSGEEALEIKGL